MPKVYSVNTAVTTLILVNFGGIIQASTYGLVSNFTETGRAGFSNWTINAAIYDTPLDVIADNSGNTHILDLNNIIRKITPLGAVTTLAGTGA